jgi:hypothetical protein
MLGKPAGGVPAIPSVGVPGLGQRPRVPHPPIPVPNWVAQAGHQAQQAGGDVLNGAAHVYSRGPIMADPTPMGWNIKPFPHATLAHGLTFEVNGETYHVPIKGQGKVWGVEYEIGMRNVTLGDLAMDAVLFECVNPAIEDGLASAFASLAPDGDMAAQKAMAFAAWAAAHAAEAGIGWGMGKAGYETYTPPFLSPTDLGW